MLREASNVRWVREGVIARRCRLMIGTRAQPTRLTRGGYRRLLAAQIAGPCELARERGRVLWMYDGRFWWGEDDLDAGDVAALVRDRKRRRRRRLERAHAAGEQDVVPLRREAIPREVRRVVFERDGGACVQCGATFDLQYDHVIPHALGGASTAENLQVLCAPCNQAKGAEVS